MASLQKSFVPGLEAALVGYVENFDTRLTAAPTSVGCTAAQATAFHALVVAFKAAWDVTRSRSTRSGSAVILKNEKKKALVKNLRELAKIIQAYPGTTDEQRDLFGLNIPATRQPVPVPTDMALVEVKSSGPNSIKVRVHGGEALNRRKPLGSTGCVVMTYVGPEAPVDEKLWTMEGATTKSVFDISFPNDIAPGSVVWVAAAFVNAKLQHGPLTYPPTQIRLAGRVNATSGQSAVKLAA